MNPLAPGLALLANLFLALFDINITEEALQTTIQTIVAIGTGLWLYVASKKK